MEEKGSGKLCRCREVIRRIFREREEIKGGKSLKWRSKWHMMGGGGGGGGVERKME